MTRAEACARGAVRFGASLKASELCELLNGLPARNHRQALMHGDLHADNVRVRHGHAILIDFAMVRKGPLVGDPASLDTALSLNAKAAHETEWQECMTELYELSNLVRLPQARVPGSAFVHLCDAVRQVRRFGLAEEMEEKEYATAVAVFLLRHATRLPKDHEPTERRALFFALAEKIGRQL